MPGTVSAQLAFPVPVLEVVVPSPLPESDPILHEWRFGVGDLVHTYADTRPGVRGNKGEVFTGTVASIDAESRIVTINALLTGRPYPAVHESRVYTASKSINGVDGEHARAKRAAAANTSAYTKRRLEAQQGSIAKQEALLTKKQRQNTQLAAHADDVQDQLKLAKRRLTAATSKCVAVEADNNTLRTASREQEVRNPFTVLSRKGPVNPTKAELAVRAAHEQKTAGDKLQFELLSAQYGALDDQFSDLRSRNGDGQQKLEAAALEAKTSRRTIAVLTKANKELAAHADDVHDELKRAQRSLQRLAHLDHLGNDRRRGLRQQPHRRGCPTA